jgi:hypothetical protein
LQANAEAKRLEEQSKQMDKVRHMNNRVTEAEKKREELSSCDPSKTEAKLQAAEERYAALLKETQDKAGHMNSRVSEAEKKRAEIPQHDISKTEAKLQAAEERHAALIKETQERGAAEVAKVCPLLRWGELHVIMLGINESVCVQYGGRANGTNDVSFCSSAPCMRASNAGQGNG